MVLPSGAIRSVRATSSPVSRMTLTQSASPAGSNEPLKGELSVGVGHLEGAGGVVEAGGPAVGGIEQIVRAVAGQSALHPVVDQTVPGPAGRVEDVHATPLCIHATTAWAPAPSTVLARNSQ
jgi:hypothetical protein